MISLMHIVICAFTVLSMLTTAYGTSLISSNERTLLSLAAPYTQRISTGAIETWTDNDGNVWEMDQYFNNNGATYSLCPMDISNTTTLDTIYCKERYFNKWVHTQPFVYNIPVPQNGAYTVKLHFSEIHYKTAGERLFDVWIGGSLVLKNFDIYNEAGFATALVVPFTTRTKNERISIEFVSKRENPKICAIEIIEQLDYIAPPTLAPTEQLFATRISAGAADNWIDENGTTWESDKYFHNKGAVHTLCPLEINGTELDVLYCKERYFNKWEFNTPFRYDIPVPNNGTYSVKLHFAEISHSTIGARIFDVLVGGKIVYKNLDIYKEVGYMTAYILPVITSTSNGTVSIEFVGKVENPKISAIEVIEIPNYIPPPTQAPIIPTFETRISAGAFENWIDENGTTWESDKYFHNKGAVHTLCPLEINGTDLDCLYCKERYFNKWEIKAPFRYDIPVPFEAMYSVKIHFAEISHKIAGARVFDVLVNGKMVFKNLDIFKQVGYMTAFVISTISTSVNSTVSIELIAKIENPKISAIEIIELRNYIPPPTSAPIVQLLPFETRISSGATSDWEDLDGVVWEKDKYFDNKGDTFWLCPTQIAGTDHDTLYCKERFFNQWKYKAPFRYEIPVPRNGAYSVKLHFAELSHKVRGGRIFDVLVGGKVVDSSLDIFAEAGYATAYVLPVITMTRSGFVTIELVPKVEHPKICAIEVLELPDYIPPPTAAPVATGFELRMNSGGVADYFDKNGGKKWSPDMYFIGGGVLFKRHYDILWTPDDEIYHIERHGTFRYEIPVPTGTFNVSLHFTELHFSTPGSRLFDILIEDEINLKNIDIVRVTGAYRRAWVINLVVVVTDGLLSMAFSDAIPKKDMPKISGLEVKFLSSSTEKLNPFPLLINCGGRSFTERNSSKTWLSDRHFLQWQASIYNDTASLNNFISNELYHTGRTGSNFRYEIPVPSGLYEVTLHFAEPSSTVTVGKRIFDMTIENNFFANSTSIDVVKLAGGSRKPLVLKTTANVLDGLLSIHIFAKAPAIGVPLISGIEVRTIQTPSIAPVKAPTKSPSRAPVVSNRPPVVLQPKNCSVPKLTPNLWNKPFSQYPITVAEPSGDMIGKDFIIFGGFKNGYVNATNETYALDMSVPDAVWRRMDDMPHRNGITHQGMVVIDAKAYLCGGYVGGSLGVHASNCFVYDNSKPKGQQWSNITSLPDGGRSGGGMIYDSTLNAIFYAGGSKRITQGQPVAIDYKDTWMYSLNNPTAGWVRQSNMPFFGNHMNAITVEDSAGIERHYIFGGQVGDYELWGNTAIMYEYVATSDTWIKRSSMPFARGHSTFATRAISCGFIVAGGRTNKGLTGDISYYNVENDTWQTIGDLPVDIHTNICVITKTNMLRCETGWATGTFSVETPIQL